MMFFRKSTAKKSEPRKPVVPPHGMERVKFVRCASARRVALRVDAARSQICLVVPQRTSERFAWEFADSNRAWIKACLAELETPVPFEDGAVIPIFGSPRTLRIIKHDKRVTEFTLTATALEVRTSREDPARNIRDYLYKLCLETVAPMAHGKAASINKTIATIRLRDTRQRWGSCATNTRMMFCWRLVFAPMIVVDYIVGHEVAHLKHMDHSAKFWAQCDALTEDMNYSRQWLADNGDKLMMYGLPRG